MIALLRVCVLGDPNVKKLHNRPQKWHIHDCPLNLAKIDQISFIFVSCFVFYLSQRRLFLCADG